MRFLCLKRYGLFGPELEFAVFVDFRFGLHAARDFNDVREYALPDFVDRFSSVDYSTGGKIEIVRHSREYWRV